MENERKTINGELFKKMITGGVANLHANVQEVNDLNVFPIPDGDTGENMYLTLHGGYDELQQNTENSVEKEADALAKGMLLGARGNSGVILSQLFYGLAEGLKGFSESVTIKDFASALKKGVQCAYGSVARPVEGTILTVAREATDNAYKRITDSTNVEEFFSMFLEEMKISLEKTPDLLPVLKESGVIDSGGAGLVYIIEGFFKALCGMEIAGGNEIQASDKKALDFSQFTENDVMQFGYCTELLLRLQTSKTDVDAFSVDSLIEFLESIGDSVVAFKTGTIIKIHVHTLTPYKVLEHCQKFGEYLTVKIENMTLQHNETHQEEKKQTFKKPQRTRRKFAVVTVASGEGLIKTFEEMGADYVISGGQTNNPSSEDFIEAFDFVNADYVFVLPNNSNIIMAAKQAASFYKNSDIRVIESKNIGQGYSILAMLDFDSDDADAICQEMTANMQNTVTGMIAKSVRTTTVNGVDVKKDEFMGFTDKTMHVSDADKVIAAEKLLEKLDIANKEFLITVNGKTATTKEKALLVGYLSEKYPNLEVYEIEGGQDVYDFLFIIE